MEEEEGREVRVEGRHRRRTKGGRHRRMEGGVRKDGQCGRNEGTERKGGTARVEGRHRRSEGRCGRVESAEGTKQGKERRCSTGGRKEPKVGSLKGDTEGWKVRKE